MVSKFERRNFILEIQKNLQFQTKISIQMLQKHFY